MEGIVGSLLELVFWPPLPKSEVEGQVGSPVGDARLVGRSNRHIRC
jgi:hypothetical protein